jgi:hypothetical protein
MPQFRRVYVTLASLAITAANLQGQTPPRQFGADETYEHLSSLKSVERRAEYQRLTPSIQDGVWLAHLKRFFGERVDLTDDERGVVLEAIGFLATAPASIDRNDPEWEIKVARPLQALERRAKQLCRPEIAKAALTMLGPEDQPSHRGGATANGVLPRVVPNIAQPLFPCECSMESDWCDILPTSPLRCNGISCYRSPDGCGTLWRHPCDGICL